LRSGYDGKVDASVELSVGQTLDLGNVEIRVDLGAFIIPSGIICQDAGARLEMRHDGLSSSSTEVTLTVWI
jgi:hypothetical protein